MTSRELPLTGNIMKFRINYWLHDFWRTARSFTLITIGLSLLLTPASAQKTADPVTRNFKCRSNGCCDQHEWCSFWGSQLNECATNAVWMTANCQLTCKTCAAESVEGSGSAPTSTRRTEKPTPRERSRTAATTTRRETPSTTVTRPDTTRGATRASTRRVTQAVRAFSGAQTCQSISQTGMQQSSELVSQFRLVQAREDVRNRRTLGISNVFDSVSKFGCAPSLTQNQCSVNLCYHLKFRSFDGSCNNLQDPLKGSAYQPYLRLLPPQYDDGVGSPVGESTPQSSQTQRRPTPREACRFLLASPQQVLSNQWSAMLMQWGQFISHDMAKTHLHRSSDCRDSCRNVPGKCFNIEIQRNDPLSAALRQQPCFKMARSAPTCGTGQNGRPRQQYNENSPFIDASQVYGSSEDDHRRFRSGASAFMETTTRGSSQLPKHDTGKCAQRASCTNRLFETGDDRSNIFVGLATHHTLFLREHNRIATAFKQLNPRWSDDQVFQEARKIIGAVLQQITFKEWLPKILGSRFDVVVGTYTGYDPNVNPAIANEFNSAAFRFGHGMIQEIYDRLDPQGRVMNKLKVDDGINHPDQIVFGGGIDPIIRGLMVVGAKRPQRMSPAVTERMFGNTDLAATNIQRGRDHGIPPYNEYRAFCGLPKQSTFEGFKNEILDGQLRRNLEQGYGSPDVVDLYVGAILEDPVVGGMVGPTLSCIIGDQFKRLRNGDRFWYENQGVFTPAQLAEIEKHSLARILCDNADQFEFVPRDAFELTTGPNLVSCREIPGMDLGAWREA